MNSNDNLLFLHGNGYHFVISYTLKRSKQEFKDAVFDDYYAVVTDRMDLTTEVVIYRGQWKIEEGFRVLKTDLQARPVFFWTDDHIKGRFPSRGPWSRASSRKAHPYRSPPVLSVHHLHAETTAVTDQQEPYQVQVGDQP